MRAGRKRGRHNRECSPSERESDIGVHDRNLERIEHDDRGPADDEEKEERSEHGCRDEAEHDGDQQRRRAECDEHG